MSNQHGPKAFYSTHNTNLAACIGSLKVPVKTEQPVTIVVDNESGYVLVKFWFEDKAAEPFCGEIHEPRALERHWSHREELEASEKFHPLVPMRRALDRRDWLTKAWHGRIMPAASLDKGGFATEDIILASVLMASGFDLLRLDKPRYVFRKVPPAILNDFRDFEELGVIERPAALMRRALEARKLLMREVDRAKRDRQLRFSDGIADAHGGKTAFISERSTDKQISQTLELLYQP